MVSPRSRPIIFITIRVCCFRQVIEKNKKETPQSQLNGQPPAILIGVRFGYNDITFSVFNSVVAVIGIDIQLDF